MKRLKYPLLIGALVVFSYSRWVETRWIEVTRHRVEVATLPSESTLRLAHLTDLHVVDIGAREEKTLRLLKDAQPDILVITGDTITTNKNWPAVEAFLKQLVALRPPFGIFAVRGNWEHWADTREAEFAAFQNAGVTLLDNANREIRPDLWLVGFDDALTGTLDVEKSFAGVPSPEEATVIALFHTPAFYDQIRERVSLAFAGHTHAGQFRIPGLPPLYLPPGSWPYVEGWYDGQKFYVSRGVGNSGLNMRFGCRPEIALHTLTSRSSSPSP